MPRQTILVNLAGDVAKVTVAVWDGIDTINTQVIVSSEIPQYTRLPTINQCKIIPNPWQDFGGKANPVASAFMAKMKVRKQDRLLVKFECLRGLTELNLNPAQLHLLLGFVDTYLELAPGENTRLLEQLGRIEGKQKEAVMQIVTSWERQGIEKGRQEGRQEQGSALVLRQLKRKLGKISKPIEQTIATLPINRLNDLGEALLDFNSETDLRDWLEQVGQ
jgi:Domain of unknown function (DUF4351)